LKLIGKRQNPNDLLIIDVSNPRNVEAEISSVPHVKLYNYDDLHLIAEKNRKIGKKVLKKLQK
jgi:glutamyl-tRNA reductase